MAIPSGSGTEVLKRSYKSGNSGAWFTAIDGVANHIYTVLSIVVSENAGNEEQVTMRVLGSGSQATENKIEFVKNQVIPATGTFVFNDRLVLTGTDHLEIYTTAGDCEIYVSYIDQDWS